MSQPRPPDGFDMESAVQRDVDTLRQSASGGLSKPSLAKVIEAVCWGLVCIAGTFMVVSMPWVGDGNLIPGEVWLGYSLLGMLFFGGLALGMRWLAAAAPAMDTAMDARMTQKRGR